MENWCKEHETDWFKTPKMKAYAHPVKDASGTTTGWCNMPKEEAAHPSTYENVPLVTEVVNMGAKVVSVTTKPPSDPRSTSIARAVAFKGAIELACAGKIDTKDIGTYAKRVTPWLDKGE